MSHLVKVTLPHRNKLWWRVAQMLVLNSCLSSLQKSLEILSLLFQRPERRNVPGRGDVPSG